MKIGHAKQPNTFRKLPVYQPLQRKYWDWKEKKPKNSASMGWMEVIEQTESVTTLVDMKIVITVWPFGDDHSVLETFRGAFLVELPFEKVSEILLAIDFS